MKKREAPNMFDCFSSRQQYENIYQVTSYYYALKVSAETKQFATQKQIMGHGYIRGSLIYSKNRLGDQNCVEGNDIQTKILQREGIQAFQILLDALSPISWAVLRHYHVNSRPIGRSSLNLYTMEGA